MAEIDCLIIESPNQEIDFETLNEQKKKVEFSYDKQIIENIDLQTKITPSEVFKKFALMEKRPNFHENRSLALQFIRKNETPLEKFQRIQEEMQELKKNIEFSKAKEKNAKSSDNILSEIAQMQNELEEIASKKEKFSWIKKKTQNYGIENHLELLKEEIQSRITQRIIDKLQKIGETNFQQETKDSEFSSAKFEFFLSQENENLKKMIKYQELERKIQKLEKFVGVNTSTKLEGSIVSTVSKIDEFSDCMNISKMEALARNIQTINHELDQVLLKNKNRKISQEESDKIEELYQKLQASEGCIEELSNIINRLESLKGLHEESAGLALNISTIKNSQHYMEEVLNENQEFVKQLEENFIKNIEILNKNLKIIESRLENIKKK